jgi:hypothetical protein
MKQKMYQGAFPAAFIVVTVAFLSAIFFANPNLSFAASGSKKSPAVAKTSAVDHTEARIKQLKSALKITEDQEVLWNDLTQVMRDNAKEMDASTKERTENTKNMNAVERLKFHSQMTEVHLNQQKKFIPVFEALYNSLSDEQKKITDSIFRTGKHGKHKFQ